VRYELNCLYNMDCMEAMKDIPDKYFELSIVDPPYGIGVDKMTLGNGKRRVFRGNESWDNKKPTQEYFTELFRVSKNQIVFGANHFISSLRLDSPCWIFWDKGTGDNDYADGELAWTSFGGHVRKYFKSWVGANAKEKEQPDRIHPTQKPVALYEWLLKNYAKPGDKILDTHVGSASSLIACYNMGFDYMGFEIDADYYKAAQERINAVKSQIRLTDIVGGD
jgi:site-specific DNA-methyltransferase (adenine-specific)